MHAVFTIGYQNIDRIKKKKAKPWSHDWLIVAGAQPGFCSMKRLGVQCIYSLLTSCGMHVDLIMVIDIIAP